MRYATRHGAPSEPKDGERGVPITQFVILSREELSLISRDMEFGQLDPENLEDDVIVEWMMDTVDVEFGNRGVGE